MIVRSLFLLRIHSPLISMKKALVIFFLSLLSISLLMPFSIKADIINSSTTYGDLPSGWSLVFSQYTGTASDSFTLNGASISGSAPAGKVSQCFDRNISSGWGNATSSTASGMFTITFSTPITLDGFYYCVRGSSVGSSTPIYVSFTNTSDQTYSFFGSASQTLYLYEIPRVENCNKIVVLTPTTGNASGLTEFNVAQNANYTPPVDPDVPLVGSGYIYKNVITEIEEYQTYDTGNTGSNKYTTYGTFHKHFDLIGDMDIYYNDNGSYYKLSSNVSRFEYNSSTFSTSGNGSTQQLSLTNFTNSARNYGSGSSLYQIGLDSSFTFDNYYIVASSSSDALEVHDSGLSNLVENGNMTSQTATHELDNTTSDLSSTADQYHNLENTFINDLDSNLQNLTLDSNLITNGNFLTSANWVRTQFNRMTNNNPFGSMIFFTLSLGIALAIIGKIRS